MDGILGTIIFGILVGIIVGPLARLVLPGKQNISLIMTIGIGAVGAIGGDLIYGALGGDETGGIDWIRWVVRVGVAVVLVLIYGATAGNKSTAT